MGLCPGKLLSVDVIQNVVIRIFYRSNFYYLGRCRTAAQPHGEQRGHHVRSPAPLHGQARALHLREVRVRPSVLQGTVSPRRKLPFSVSSVFHVRVSVCANIFIFICCHFKRKIENGSPSDFP
jgi:hypothetical protein